MAVEYVLLICAVVCYFIVLLSALLFCEPGYGGYPDIWKNKTAEKVYIICGTLSPALALAALLIVIL